ncbi:MAG: YrhK family protein [Maritimibacter sp.]
MALFRQDNWQETDKSRRVYARYEIAHTAVDFAAAILFLIGSFLFFSAETQYVATWMFVIGSACFAMKPTLRLSREIHLYRLGKLDRLAAREAEM